MCASRAARSESESLPCTFDDIVEFNIFGLDPYQIADARRISLTNRACRVNDRESCVQLYLKYLIHFNL